MATGTHVKVDRPAQEGYEIALTPETHRVNRVRIRFGSKVGEDKEDGPIFRWDITIGPFEVQPDPSSKTLIKIDSDQLPVPASTCFYQLVCECDIEDGIETLLTKPVRLT